MTPEQQIAGARLVHNVLVMPDKADPATDVVNAFRDIERPGRGGVLLGAVIYGVAMSRALLMTLEANGIDPTEALTRHGETLELTDMYHRTQEADRGDS